MSLRFRGMSLTPFGNISTLHGEDLARELPLDFITPLKIVVGLRVQDKRDRFWSGVDHAHRHAAASYTTVSPLERWR